MNKHTPGPWASRILDRLVICDSEGQEVARAFGGHNAETRARARANARLIKALPELLEALKHAVEIAENKRPGTWDDLLLYRALIDAAEEACHD